MANIRPLNAELRKIANEELNEVESRIPEDIAALKTWLEKQPHLRSRTSDQFLVTFLRGCKYSLEKTKSKIDHFYTIKTMMPETFARTDVSDFFELARCGAYTTLLDPMGPAGPRLHVTKYSKLNTKKFTIPDLFAFQTYMMEMEIASDDNVVISGEIEIIDFGEMNLSMLAQFDLAFIKKMAVFSDKAAPIRIKGVHILNCPKEGVALLNLGRSFLSQKVQKRFYIHKNFDELHKVIPKEYLPAEYGGTNSTMPEIMEQRAKQFEIFMEQFKDEAQYGVDEKLRPGKKMDKETLFGIDGSFRKLDID